MMNSGGPSTDPWTTLASFIATVEDTLAYWLIVYVPPMGAGRIFSRECKLG